jgi:hypothetical protein
MSAQTPRPALRPDWRTAIGYQIGFVGFIRLGCLLRQVRYLPFIDPRRMPRLLLPLATSLCLLPLRLWERVRFGARIARVEIASAPVFIIGHWRSGTTHLHNLMSQDRGFGCVSMYQALVPDCSLVGGRWLKPLLARIVPATRPMDNMVWPLDAPQEEEIALAKTSPYSCYLQFLFPRQALAIFERSVLLNGASPAMIAAIERAYRRLLQIATWHAGGKRLLLKNPVNSARVRLLLRLFPDAKFIHIHRSPYEVYPSTVHLFDRVQQVLSLQSPRHVDNPETALQIYELLMRRLFADRALIPPGNLVEVRYKDLTRDPEGEVKRIYDTLGLPGHTALAPALRAYLATVRTYRRNEFALTAEERTRIAKRLGFAFDALGYARDPNPEQTAARPALALTTVTAPEAGLT